MNKHNNNSKVTEGILQWHRTDTLTNIYLDFLLMISIIDL